MLPQKSSKLIHFTHLFFVLIPLLLKYSLSLLELINLSQPLLFQLSLKSL